MTTQRDDPAPCTISICVFHTSHKTNKRKMALADNGIMRGARQTDCEQWNLADGTLLILEVIDFTPIMSDNVNIIKRPFMIAEHFKLKKIKDCSGIVLRP